MWAALLQKLDTAKREAAEARAESKRLRGDNATTPEQLTAALQRIEKADADLKAADDAIAAYKRAEELEAIQPAAAVPGTGALPAYSSTVTVKARFEEDPKRGYKSVGEFAQSVAAAALASRTGGRIDERLAHARQAALADDGVKVGAAAPNTYQQEGHSTEGFMIPPDFRAEIWKPAFEQDDLLALVNPQPTESNTVQFWTDESTPWGAAGVVAYWLTEAGKYTATKLPTKGGELKLEKVGCLVHCTDEVLEDAPLLTSRINEAAPQAIGWTVGEAIMRGNGTGKPLGWESAACKVSVAKETSQTAATIVTKNIAKMFARLLRGPGARPLWLLNTDTVPELIELKIGNEPSWVGQDRGLQQAPNGTLLGVPVSFSEHCKSLGTTGDIQLVNLAGYAAFIKSGGTRFDSSIHLYFDYGIQSFRWTMRVGGQPLLSAAISPANGNNTKSHFVLLDTRA